MDRENAEVKRKLKDISSIKDFEDLIGRVMLSEEETEMLMLIYKDKKTITFVADKLGLSESSVKKKHRRLLMKIGRVV